MAGTHFKKGVTAGTKGDATVITKIKKDVVSVTVSALAAGAEEDIDVSVADAAPGDIIIVTPTEAAMETGLSVSGAWAAAEGTMTIRVSNQSGSGLTGSTESWSYLIMKS